MTDGMTEALRAAKNGDKEASQRLIESNSVTINGEVVKNFQAF